MVAVASEAVPWRVNASEANKNLGGFDLYLPGVGSLIPAHTQIWASVWFARFLMNRKSFATPSIFPSCKVGLAIGTNCPGKWTFGCILLT